MHSLYFVKLKEAENAVEAVEKARQLLEQEGFTGESCGYWCNHKGDWHSMGGRWSSFFTELKPEHKKAVETLKESEIVKKCYKEYKTKETIESYLNILTINPHLIKEDKDRTEINKIYKDIVGHNFFRNRLSDNDETEMAEKITPELLKHLKKDYKEVEIAVVDEGEYISEEITCKDLTKNDIGEWLIIVDYHN